MSLTSEQLVDALRRYNKLPALKRRRSSSASRRTPVRTAGRLSLASEDGLQTSPRLKNTYYSGGGSKRRFVPAEDHSSSGEGTPQRTSIRRSLPATTPFLPVRDPEGNPVRWQIHNPYVIDLVSDDEREKSANVSPKSSNKKKKKKKFKILWGRIIFVLVTLTSLICAPKQIQRLASKAFSVLLSVVLPKTRTYCDTGHISPTSECLPCPEHARCEEGKIACESPRYFLVRSFGTMRCVADQAADRAANRLRSELIRYLRQKNGEYECLGTIPPHSRIFENKVALSKSGIEELVDKLQNQFPRHYGREGPKSIFMSDLQQEAFGNTEGGIKAANDGTFYTTHVDLPFKCKIKQLAWKFGPYVAVVLITFLWLRAKYRRWRFTRALKAAVAEVIRDHTKVQRLQNDEEAKQGYAIGPRADDIYEMLTGNDKYKKWEKLFIKKLNKKDVANICEWLVARGVVCRSLLAADMTPFYFNRSIIERGKVN